MEKKDEFAGWTPDQLQAFILEGKEPDLQVGTPSGVRIPARTEESSQGEYTPAKPVGSFTEGLKAGLSTPGFAVARAMGLENAETNAKSLGKDIEAARVTPMGDIGLMTANFIKGMGVPFLRSAPLVNTGLSAAAEAADVYGGGGGDTDVLTGAGRGAISGATGSAIANLATKGINAARGKWSDDAEKYLYDFAKSKGVNLRPGDVGEKGILRTLENTHVGSIGAGGVMNQASQLENALFGNGNQILDGFKRAKSVIDDANKQLWEPVYQAASQGTTLSPAAGLRQALNDTLSTYPKLLNRIDNVQLQQKLADVLNGGKLSFQDMRELQQAIGPEMAKLKMQSLNGTITRDEANTMSRLYGAVAGDIKRWGNHGNNQTAYKMYEEANDAYKKHILPFYDNDIVNKWQSGKYDGHNELLIRDLISPVNATQQDKLLWYLGKTDHDAAGNVLMLKKADRAAKILASGEPESSLGLNLLSPTMTAARIASARGAGKTWMTPISGASSNILPTLSKDAVRPSVSGGLSALVNTVPSGAENYITGSIGNRLSSGARGVYGMSVQEENELRRRMFGE